MHDYSNAHGVRTVDTLIILAYIRRGTTWQTISGGSIQTPDCGSIDLPGFSSEAAFFYGSGTRYIETIGLDLRYSG